MGTRSLTILCDEKGKDIAVLYRQYDGYPSGHGKDLCEYLAGYKVGANTDKNIRTANGMECLAASIVGAIKDGPGNVYLYPAGSRDCGEEYRYYVRQGLGGGEPLVEFEEAYGDEESLGNHTPSEWLTTHSKVFKED